MEIRHYTDVQPLSDKLLKLGFFTVITLERVIQFL